MLGQLLRRRLCSRDAVWDVPRVQVCPIPPPISAQSRCGSGSLPSRAEGPRVCVLRHTLKGLWHLPVRQDLAS